MDPQDRDNLELLVEVTIGAFYEVSNTLGPGFLEKVYERALLKELALRQLPVKAQVQYPVMYKGQMIGEYTADMVVAGKLLVELKCVASLGSEHMAQCINYLKASNLTLALLVNFQHPKVVWRRIVHNL